MTAEAFFADDLADTPSEEQTLLDDLKSVLRQQHSAAPRHLQKQLGPSQVGYSCTRRLAGELLQLERINPEGDPLPSWLGTAGHTRFEDAIALDNQRVIDQWKADPHTRCTVGPDGRPVGRWLSERRVTIREGLDGTADLYDTWTDTVIDLKFPGATAFTNYRKHGPSQQYRVQAHLYGRGYRNENYPVKRVAIWFLPRGGFLSSSFIWSEPYDDQTVEAALSRIDATTVVIHDLNIEHHPQLLDVFPKDTTECAYCPFWSPRPDPAQRPHACPGIER